MARTISKYERAHRERRTAARKAAKTQLAPRAAAAAKPEPAADDLEALTAPAKADASKSTAPHAPKPAAAAKPDAAPKK